MSPPRIIRLFPRHVLVTAKRKTYPETIFGEAKNHHGLTRAICRGRDKVIIQALLTSAIQNIKRLVKHCYTPITNSVSFVLEQFRFGIRKPHLQVT